VIDRPKTEAKTAKPCKLVSNKVHQSALAIAVKLSLEKKQ